MRCIIEHNKSWVQEDRCPDQWIWLEYILVSFDLTALTLDIARSSSRGLSVSHGMCGTKVTFEQDSGVGAALATLPSIYISRHMIHIDTAVTAERPLLQSLPDNAPFTGQLQLRHLWRLPWLLAAMLLLHQPASFSSSWPLTSEALYLSRSRYLNICAVT